MKSHVETQIKHWMTGFSLRYRQNKQEQSSAVINPSLFSPPLLYVTVSWLLVELYRGDLLVQHTPHYTTLFSLSILIFSAVLSLSLPPTAAGLWASPAQLTRIHWQLWREPLLSTDEEHTHAHTFLHFTALTDTSTDLRWLLLVSEFPN